MKPVVEPITERDIEHLVHLFSNAGPYVSARTLSDYWLYARLFSTTCLCVRDDAGRPVAAVIAFRDQTPGRQEIYIQDVAVDADHRRQGLGEAILDEIHRRAATWQIARIWLTSEAENVGAMKLWTKLDYENPPADYQADGIWLTSNLKGPNRDRAIFERRSEAITTSTG